MQSVAVQPVGRAIVEVCFSYDEQAMRIGHQFSMTITVMTLLYIIASDRKRIFVNWLIICCINVLVGITYFIQTPLLHQYITTRSTNLNDTQTQNSNIEAGLGLSEGWYSAIISTGSVGVILGAVLYGLIAKHTYVKFGLLMGLLMELLGGILYSFSSNGWLVILLMLFNLAKLFNGIFIGLQQSLMRNYASETSEKLIQSLPLEMKNKSTMKYTILFILFCCTYFGLAFGPVITVLGAYINPFHSQFRWPGYWICFHSVTLFLLVLFVFNDHWQDIIRCSSNNKEKLIWKIKRPVVPYTVFVFFVYVHVVSGWNMSIVETLQNPILSDQFGLNIENMSFVLFGVLTVYLIATAITYAIQKCKVDNRKILLGSILIGASGALIMADWQAIRGDPCNQFSLLENSTTLCDEMNTEHLNDCLDYEYRNKSDGYFCEALGRSHGYDCFWNPVSRLTGEYCERCRQVCLSQNHTLNFVQLIIGVVLLSYSYVPGRLLVTSIASDVARNKPQGWLMGVLVASSAFSRATGPFIGDYTYILVGNRTWLASLAMFSAQLLTILFTVICYKRLKKSLDYNILDERELCSEEIVTNGNRRHDISIL